MYNIILWSWWKHRLHFIFLVATFYSVTISSNLVIAQNNSATTTTTTSTVSPVNSSSSNSGSEEYYYYSEEEPAVNQTKFSNRTVIGDEYYYYLEEVVLRPKNTTGLSNWNVVVSDNFTLRPQGKTILADSAKSESVPHLVGDVSFGNGIVFPSPETLSDGPIVSSVIHPEKDHTEDFDFEYNLHGIGDGPPPPPPASPHDHVDPSVNNLVSVLHSGEHDGTPPDFLRAPMIPPVEPQDDDVEIKPFVPMPLDSDSENIVPFKLADHNKPSHPFGTVSLHTNRLPVFGFDPITWAEKNPIMAITEFLTQAYTYLSQMSKADVVVWVEKFINVLAELEVPYPDQHYLSVISFAGIYLFIALFLYGADNLSDFQCAAEGNGFPSKHWNYHASRRYVPAKSVDPHLQRKLLDLFTGDDDDDDDYLDRSSLGRSSEEDLLEELDHVSELCPKDTFFYSLNPRHIEAYSAIQRLLVVPETTERFISLARHLLHSDKVHPKVWYIGIVGAALQRPDMTGFNIVHPLDAIPDWFIPADLISDLMQEYRKIRIKRSTSLLYPTQGKPYRIVKTRPGKNYTRDGSTTFSVFSITPTLGPPSARFQLNTTNRITNSTPKTKITTPTKSPTKSSSFSTAITSTTAKMATKTHPSKKKDIVYKKHIKSPPTVKLKKGNFTVTIVSSKDINVTYSNGTIKEMSKVPFPFFSKNIVTKQKNGISPVHGNKSKNKMEVAKTKTGSIKIDDSKNKNGTTTKKSKDPPKVTTSKISGTQKKNETTTKKSREPPKVTTSKISGAKNKTVSFGVINSDTSKKRVESLSSKKKLGILNNKTVSIGTNKTEKVPKKSLGSLLDQMNKLATGVVAVDALDTSSSGSGSTEEVKGETGIVPKNPLKQNSKNTGNNKQQDEDDESLGDQSTKSNNRRKKKRKKKDKCIKVDWKSGIDNGVENELWYWREDMMLNQHHWYWHQTHPVNSTQHSDRRAELFYFMHRSLVARYNAERLSNRLPIVKPLRFGPRGILHEGYNSHLADVNSGTFWTPRWPGTPLNSIIHEHDPDFALNISMRGFMRSFGRLVKAVKTGRMYTESGMLLPIDHFKGIEPLANTVEASDRNVNPLFYDQMGIHALGHIMIALAADPDYRFEKVTGIMSEAAVSMRDPIFYTYHTFIDNFFESYKRRLAPYEPIGGDFPLLWKGIELVEIELHSQGGGPVNELRTFWSRHKFKLSPGVDRSIKKGEKHAKICAQHLDHEPFYFKIVIDRKPCVRSKSGKAMVRIFMAPRYDEKGRRIPVKIQRRLMFPMDAFPVKLRVGKNTITRYAEDSSLTQPWTKSIEDFERGPDPSGSADFCGCGFPQHLYIPKGHVAGMPFDLFVMVTDFDQDFVPNDPRDLEVPTCNSPYIFCGLQRRRRYPDRRPMGYPFDRPLFRSLNCPPGWTFFSVLCKTVNMILNNPIDTLEQYVSKVPNMAMLKFHIKHLDALFPEPARHR